MERFCLNEHQRRERSVAALMPDDIEGSSIRQAAMISVNKSQSFVPVPSTGRAGTFHFHRNQGTAMNSRESECHMIRGFVCRQEALNSEINRMKRKILADNARLELFSQISALNNPVIAFVIPPALVRSLNIDAELSSREVVKSPSTEVPTPKRLRQGKPPVDVFESLSYFPLPPVNESNIRRAKIGKLSKFRKTWARLERYSVRMDDTAASQEAFVKEFFQRSIHSYESDHLKKRLRESIEVNKGQVGLQAMNAKKQFATFGMFSQQNLGQPGRSSL